MSTTIIFGNNFRISDLVSLWSRDFTIFQSWRPKWLLLNSKAVDTCEEKKRGKSVPVWQQYLKKLDIKLEYVSFMSSALMWGEAYSATGMSYGEQLFSTWRKICQITDLVEVK